MAWSTITGFGVVLVPALVTGPHSMPGTTTLLWLASGAIGSMFGLWTMMLAYRHGALSVVSPIIACEGAVIAVVNVVLGNPLELATGLLLVIATVGAAIVVHGTRGGEGPRETPPIAIVASVASAVFFGIGLYSAAVAADDVGPFFPSLVTRLLGLIVITAPVLLVARAGIGDKIGLRWSLAGGALDVGGMLFFVASAQAGDVSVAGVLSSQSAAIATVLGLLVLRERMSRGQRLGFAMIIVAVTALAAGI
jgi:drug/metabolite transporter (DMT)-like permease